MILIIDGYNLLKHIDPHHDISEHERTVFLHQLKRYARRKKHKIVLVFDGGPYQWPHKELVNGIKVIYSGERDTADTVIMRYIADHKTQDLLLISSDHELNLFASKYDIASIGSDDFYPLFKQGIQEYPEEVEEIEVSIDEGDLDLDALMEQASEMVPCKQEDITPSDVHLRTGRSSKKDRLLLKKLKKL
ncbi:hypothetical protein E3J61_04070 [Candidatus Dependentiae bacterium]|nr:MAG: hypothetical protein E3J61_04070 [Candidatus Dependentiae bacterium]